MTSSQSETLEERKTFRRDGQLWLHEFYKNGVLEGKFMSWYADGGQLWEQKFYRNGKLEGEYANWYQNGQLREQSFWKNDELEGEAKMRYMGNGRVHMQEFYHNGKWEGTRKIWDNEAIDNNFTRKKKNGFLRLKRYLRNCIIHPLDTMLILDLARIVRG